MRDRLDAESAHVEELRVTDDTGPLLRRALDHVSTGEAAAEATAAEVPGAAVPEPPPQANGSGPAEVTDGQVAAGPGEVDDTPPGTPAS
jgi:hypothetical protein